MGTAAAQEGTAAAQEDSAAAAAQGDTEVQLVDTVETNREGNSLRNSYSNSFFVFESHFFFSL